MRQFWGCAVRSQVSSVFYFVHTTCNLLLRPGSVNTFRSTEGINCVTARTLAIHVKRSCPWQMDIALRGTPSCSRPTLQSSSQRLRRRHAPAACDP